MVNVTPQLAFRDVAVTIESISSRTIGIEAKLKSPPPIGWAQSDPAIEPPRAIVSGRSSLVDRVARLVVTVDATTLKPSVDDFVQIKALDARGRELDGIRVSPDGAHIALRLVEAPAGKLVFVSPTVTGQPQFPYQVTKISVTPSSVTIKGRPETLVNSSTISTEEVDVTGATADVVRRTTLRLPPRPEHRGLTHRQSDRANRVETEPVRQAELR
jgi:YbbR domain-containing protein